MMDPEQVPIPYQEAVQNMLKGEDGEQ
jgi:hypothetical protein